MTGPDVRQSDPGSWLLDRIDAREHSLTCQIKQTQAEIDTLAARMSELSEAIEHLRISRKTLISLADEDPAPAEPPPTVPDHPAYQQILAAFDEAGGSLRARDLALAMGLPLSQNNIQNVRAKLKRLASRGILIETEPGLFTQPRP